MHGTSPDEPPLNPFDLAAKAFIEKRRGIIKVPAHLSVTPLLPTLVGCVRELIAEPEEIRALWKFNVIREGDIFDEPDDGLLRKEKANNKDSKWFFHYRVSLEQLLKKRGVDTTRHKELLSTAREAHWRLYFLSQRFANVLDRILPGYNLSERITSEHAWSYHTLRILIYDKARAETNVIGKDHTDRAAFTLHVAESRPGLVTQGETTPYDAKPHEILAFPSDKLQRLSDAVEYPAEGKRFRALPHKVLDLTDPSLCDEGRWSVIYFVHIRGFGALPDSKT